MTKPRSNGWAARLAILATAATAFAACAGRASDPAPTASASVAPLQSAEPLDAGGDVEGDADAEADVDDASVAIDASAFVADDAGVPDAGATPPPCPDESMARIGRFCIDRWEAHLEAPADDGGFTPWPPNERPTKGVLYRAASASGGLPQAYVSRVEAKAACKSAGKRLCSMREWRRACQGKRGTHYPYGPNFKRDRCNVGKPHLLAQLFGSDARHWKYDEHFNDPKLDTLEGYLAKSGEYAGCASEMGVFDLSGNLHEWVSDVVDEAFVERLELDKVDRRKQPWKLGNGVFVGGFFSTTDQHGPGCLFTTFAHEPAYHDYSIGFRCCAEATAIEEAAPKPEKHRRRGADGGVSPR